MHEWESDWRGVPWETARRARALGLACRLDRQLEEAAAAASRAEARLAATLRAEVREAVARATAPEALYEQLCSLHAQLAYLPRVPLPAGIGGLLRDLLGPGWDGDVVVAGVPRLSWPRLDEVPQRPVAVIPWAEARCPLLWPLVAVQGARAAGESERVGQLKDSLGAALAFARAEVLCFADEGAAREAWEAGQRRLAAAPADWLAIVRRLADTLAAGVLISGFRRDERVEEGAPIYRQLSVVKDQPAQPEEILTAGWLHWYARVAAVLVQLTGPAGNVTGGDDPWPRLRALVDSFDDLLCRSLEVAAIHRFYAAEGAIG